MSEKTEYKRVNWVEGMDVHFNQFEQTENYFTATICDALAIQLNKHNFGLLPSPDGETASSEFAISETIHNTIEIRLSRCNAVTAGGCRISYNPAQEDALLLNHAFESEKEKKGEYIQTLYWDIILTVDPFKRVPSGIPDPEATPPRHPDADSFYTLSIVKQGELNMEQLGRHYLVIGRIRSYGGRYEVDTNFIPPSTSMASHTALIDYYHRFGKLLNDIEKSSKTILEKIRNRSHNSTIATHIGSLCEDLMRYIASIYFDYRNIGLSATPIRIVSYFSTLAHTSYASLNFINKTEKEELLRYFYEWSDVTPGSFEELLSNTLSILYDHNNIRSVMLQVESFLQVFSELWWKLSRLEYIGQHKDNIVVSERTYQQEQPKKTGGWSILD